MMFLKNNNTSGSHSQGKRLQKSDIDSEMCATPSKRRKIANRLTNLEIRKQLIDKVSYQSLEDAGTYESEEDYGTCDSREDEGTYESQEDESAYENQDDESQDDEDIYDENLFHGTNETQVAEGGEAELHKHFVDCTKNPGHKKFVPVNDFNINHMPEGYHDNDLVEYIKATADLTVRVDVKMTSKERPEFLPGTTVPYAFYKLRGRGVLRLGSGTVWYVNKRADNYFSGTCQCLKFQNSNTPSRGWGKVRMYTARHVVFDELEARHTTCRLFYDGQDSPVVTLDGWTVVVGNIVEDWCMLECATCDVDVLDKLDKIH